MKLVIGARSGQFFDHMHSNPRVAVIILNFRTPEITIDCLKTIASEAEANPGMSVTVLDNASGDESVAKISAAILAHGWSNGWLEFRPLDKNLGFAGGNNLIMREKMALNPSPEYLLLLNSDTLVRPGCISTCLRIMENDPRIGALSCMLRNHDGSVQNVCRKFPTPLRESLRSLGLPWFLPRLFAWADLEDKGWDREKTARDVDWISGAFFMGRTSALRKAGLMDEEFFFYGEDCEWCHRIRKNGWRIRFDPTAEIVHLGGGSSDSTRLVNRRKDILSWKARFQVQRKCYGRAAEILNLGLNLLSFGGRKFLMQVTGNTNRGSYNWICEGFDQLLSLASGSEK